MSRYLEKYIFWSFFWGFSFLFLFLISFTSYLPMQDFPQHLFQALVYAIRGTDHFWNNFFETHVSFGPYSFFYYFVSFFYQLSGSIFFAGKLFVSFSFILFIYMLYRIILFLKKEGSPWVVLLGVPVFFNQTYYLGFTNYIFSIPLLMLLVFELFHISFVKREISWLKGTLLSLGHLLLFLSHPYCLIFYLVLSSAFLIFLLIQKKPLSKVFFLPFFTFLTLVLWGVSLFDFSLAFSQGGRFFSWWSFETSSEFFFLFFFNQNYLGKFSFLIATLWVVVFLFYLFFLFKMKNRNSPYFVFSLGLFFFFFILYWSLPTFVKPSFSYFNARMAPFVYISALMVLSLVKVPRFVSFFVVIFFLWQSYGIYSLHVKVSEEISEIEKVSKLLPKEAVFLPLGVDSRSSFMDFKFYYEFYKHLPYYHHLLTGSGLSFFLFKNPLQALQIKKGIRVPPVPRSYRQFRWDLYEKFYHFILMRGDESWIVESMPYDFEVIGESGKWKLFGKES